MELREYDADDGPSVRAATDVRNATRAVDCPWMPPLTAHRHELMVRYGVGGNPERHFLLLDGATVVGEAAVEVGVWDNTDLAWFTLGIHPGHRRRGHGTRAVDLLGELAVRLGCSKIGTNGWESADRSATRFADSHGFDLAATEVQRTQWPQQLPDTLAEEAYAEAAPHAVDYDLVRLPGETPEELLDQVVGLMAVINDAPLDDLDIEDEVFSPERLHLYEGTILRSERRLYRIVARHRASGELTGQTIVVVDTDEPALAFQHDTSVVRAHRGHRLGLLLKADMMRWLADVEPAVEQVITWNAASNAHMVTVNERLGYRVMGRELDFQRKL